MAGATENEFAERVTPNQNRNSYHQGCAKLSQQGGFLNRSASLHIQTLASSQSNNASIHRRSQNAVYQCHERQAYEEDTGTFRPYSFEDKQGNGKLQNPRCDFWECNEQKMVKRIRQYDNCTPSGDWL